VVIGPFTPGFVADASIASSSSEIGVMLLMFGVGLHFSLDDLLGRAQDRRARRGRADDGGSIRRWA
jgi:predicted Kef-type K+ transport protein